MVDTLTYEKFIAGIELCGHRMPNGKIQAFPVTKDNVIIDKFPQEFTIHGNTYTLESVESNCSGFISAQYV